MLINPEALVIITSNISPWERGAGEERQGRDGKTRKAKHKESHTEHITTSTVGFLKIWDTKKSESGKVDAYLGVFQMQLQQSLQSSASSAVDFKSWWVLYYSTLLWHQLISKDFTRMWLWCLLLQCYIYKKSTSSILHRVIRTAFLSCGLALTLTSSSWHRWFLLLPHLTSLLKTDQQYNLITATLQRETSVNTSPFLSPYTSGQVDKVLKGNKCGLTATSKSSARGLLLLRAQECCC